MFPIGWRMIANDPYRVVGIVFGK